MRSSKAEALADCLLEQQRPLLTTRALTVDCYCCDLNLFVLVLAAGFMKLQTVKILIIHYRKTVIIHE